MTYWIQNISKEPLLIDKIIGNDVINVPLETNNKAEITDNCYEALKYHKPSKFRVVDKPKSIFLHTIAILIYGAIITEVVHIILLLFVK